MPVTPRIELKTNSYPMQKWLLAQGFGVITMGLNEYEIYKNELKITLMRGTARISEPKNKARYVPAGPPIETPELQCLGPQSVKFGCALNVDISSIERYAEIFYCPVVPVLSEFEAVNTTQFLDLPENLRFYGLKPDGERVFGVFYNTGNENITFKKEIITPKSLVFIEL